MTIGIRPLGYGFDCVKNALSGFFGLNPAKQPIHIQLFSNLLESVIRMFYKLAIIVLCVTLTGMALLLMRHHRYETMYEMAQLHRQVIITRQQLWEQQTRIASKLNPVDLREALADTGMPYQSIMPVPMQALPIRTASKQMDISVP